MAEAHQNPCDELLDKLSTQIPSDPRAQNTLSALKDAVEQERRKQAEQDELLASYQEAYEKLSSPAFRIGVFLRWEPRDKGDDLALIAVGEQEFLAEVDPLLERGQLSAGSQIRVNEAYVVVGIVQASDRGSIVKVSEVLPDGRLRLGGDTPGSDGRVITRSDSLKDATIQAGDEVRIDPSGHFVVEVFEKSDARDYFMEEIPVLPWEKIGGQDEVIQMIRETIEQPLLHPELFKKFEKKSVKGILLYGPPGCGKTLIGKATAYNLTQEYSKLVGRDVKEYFMAISGPKILNMWLGETERIVREIFATAREKAKEGRLVFIFMDEAESVLRTRSSGRWLNISNTVVPQFCAELDGLVSLDNVVLMLTSNRPDYIDPAILRPERIDRKVKIGRPDKEATHKILGIYMHEQLPYDPALLARYDGEPECARKELLDALTDRLWKRNKETEFLRVFLRNGSSETLYQKDLISGALLKSIIDRAKDFAIKRAIAEPSVEHGLRLEDLLQAADREFKENEIFPKGDTQEDWLQLLDYAPENVASVKPIGRNRGAEITQKSVI
ncbi:MAG: AAA family ATPase [Armatimonadetes bacterium]|nr:AAA family ATPase [Armatimonadota bacterium]